MKNQATLFFYHSSFKSDFDGFNKELNILSKKLL